LAKMIKIDQLSPLPFRSPPDQVSDELIESIRKDGVHYPIIITPNGEVIDGQKTVEAARIVGLTKVPAVEVKLWRQVMDILSRRHSPEAVALTPVTNRRCWEVMTGLKPYVGFRAAERREALQPGDKLDKSNSREDVAKALGMPYNEFRNSVYLYNQLSIENPVPRAYKEERIAAVEAGLEGARTAVHRLYRRMDDLNQAKLRISGAGAQAKILPTILSEAEALASTLEQIHHLNPALDQSLKDSARVTFSRLRQAATRIARSTNSPSKDSPHEEQEESGR
jgi:ParB-like nuclease domain